MPGPINVTRVFHSAESTARVVNLPYLDQGCTAAPLSAARPYWEYPLSVLLAAWFSTRPKDSAHQPVAVRGMFSRAIHELFMCT